LPLAALHGRSDIYLSVFDVFKPIQNLWQVVFENNLAAALNFIYVRFQEVPTLNSIGAYGLAIVVLTICIRLILTPLVIFQIRKSRQSMLEQRKVAPQVAELRKKFKGDAVRLNSEMNKLYQEHGINPVVGMMLGCLPALVQIPILTALFYVFTGFAHSAKVAAHFLWIPNLNDNPNNHLLFHLPLFGIGIPVLGYLAFPVLAAASTYVQTKMLQMPPAPNLTEQELQTQQMQRMMLWLSPLMIGYFAFNVPAGLGLYWFIGNCVGIIQQSFVVGWGNVLPWLAGPRTAAVVDTKSVGGTKSIPTVGGTKSIPASGLKNSTVNGPKPGTGSGPANGSQTGSPNRRSRRKRKR